MPDSFFTTTAGRRWLEKLIFPAWMPQQRWFAGKARGPRTFTIVRQAAFGDAWLLAVEVAYATGANDTYLVPLVIGDASPKEIARTEDGRSLLDATHDAAFREGLFRLMAAGATRSGLHGTAGTYLTKAFPTLDAPTSRVLSAEQSNSSLIFGDRLFAKLYRKIVPGINPDTEITRFLSEHAQFPHVPAFGGSIEWGDAQLLLALELRANDGNAWELALRKFQDCIEDPNAIDTWKPLAILLGRRTGEFHRALFDVGAQPEAPQAFQPETLEGSALEHLRGEIEAMSGKAEAVLKQVAENHPAAWATRGFVDWHDLSSESTVRLPTPWRKALEAAKAISREGHVTITRAHGDYHLGQVLYAGGDFVLIDFEGEPARTLAERRAKQPPIRDVAGMLRSFHYAAHAARGSTSLEYAELWARASQQSFLQGWRQAVAGTAVADERLLGFYLLEKLIYEVQYEMNNRPDWLHIPVRGLGAAPQ